MDKFFTPKEIANSLSVSTRTVINMIRTGKLRAVNVAGLKRMTYRVYEKELDRFIAENYERSNG